MNARTAKVPKMGNFITQCDLFSRPRMGRVIHLRQVLEVEVGVDLRAADAGVTEEFLHGTEIPAGLQQVAREAVAQHVRMDVNPKPQKAGAVS